MGKNNTGLFIVLEGCDGSGTTTQSEQLSRYYKKLGFQVFKTCEPSTSPEGKMIREALQASSEKTPLFWARLALLFASDRLYHLRHEILPALEAGKIVICDRYILSSLVYQSLHFKSSWIKTLNQYATEADLNLVLELSTEEAQKRRQHRDQAEELFEKESFQQQINQSYLKFGKQEHCTFINANKKINEVTQELIAAIEDSPAFQEVSKNRAIRQI